VFFRRSAERLTACVRRRWRDHVAATASLAWMAVLGVVMGTEKNAPWGRRIGKPVGAACLAAGVWLLVSPGALSAETGRPAARSELRECARLTARPPTRRGAEARAQPPKNTASGIS
jgi:hypothetical protein